MRDLHLYTHTLPDVDSQIMTTQHLSLLARLTRVGIALVTVWCLGCGAFDPLVGILTQTASTGMNCGSDQAGGSAPSGSGSIMDVRGGASHSQIAAAVEHHDGSGASCSCGSCSSVSPVTISLALNASPAPDAILTTVALFESIKREPLVPPPQLIS
jgi:hypothetical protein